MKLLLPILCIIAFSSFSQHNGEFHLDKDYSINAAGTLRLDIKDARVTITGSDRTTAHIKIDRVVVTKGLVFGHDEFAFDVDTSNGDLDLHERSNSVNIGIVGYYSEKYTINIQLPKSVNLAIKGGDGHYDLHALAGAISLKLDDAHVTLTGCTGSDFEFRMDDGHLSMDQGRGKFDLRGNDTHVQVLNAAFTEVLSDLDDGDLVMETSIADGGNYSIRTEDGLVAFTVLKGGGVFNVRHDDGRVTADTKFNVLEKSDAEMRLKLASGMAVVDIHADDGHIRLASR
jgi:hypothetical protein